VRGPRSGCEGGQRRILVPEQSRQLQALGAQALIKFLMPTHWGGRSAAARCRCWRHARGRRGGRRQRALPPPTHDRQQQQQQCWADLWIYAYRTRATQTGVRSRQGPVGCSALAAGSRPALHGARSCPDVQRHRPSTAKPQAHRHGPHVPRKPPAHGTSWRQWGVSWTMLVCRSAGLDGVLECLRGGAVRPNYTQDW
jgi:hypothetical protein